MKTPTKLRERRLGCAVSALALCLALLATACGDYGGGGGGSGGGAPGPVRVRVRIQPQGPSDAELQAAFEQTVHPIVTQYCVECHAGQGPGSPHIASPDPATAFRETWYNQKVSLTNPSTSRLVRRLVADFHHCWERLRRRRGDDAGRDRAVGPLVDFTGGGGGGQNVQGLVSDEPHARRRLRGRGRRSLQRQPDRVLGLQGSHGHRRARHERRGAGRRPHARRPDADDRPTASASRRAARSRRGERAASSTTCIAEPATGSQQYTRRGLGREREHRPGRARARIVSYAGDARLAELQARAGHVLLQRPQPHGEPRHRRERQPGAPDRRRRPRRAGDAPARGHHLRPVPRPAHLRERHVDRATWTSSRPSRSGTGARTTAS